MALSDNDNLQQRPNGVWMYRRRVPSDLVSAMGKIEVKVSLATEDRYAAGLFASKINEEVDRVFELLALHPDGSNEDTDIALRRLSLVCEAAAEIFLEVDVEAHKKEKDSTQL